MSIFSLNRVLGQVNFDLTPLPDNVPKKAPTSFGDMVEKYNRLIHAANNPLNYAAKCGYGDLANKTLAECIFNPPKNNGYPTDPKDDNTPLWLIGVGVVTGLAVGIPIAVHRFSLGYLISHANWSYDNAMDDKTDKIEDRIKLLDKALTDQRRVIERLEETGVKDVDPSYLAEAYSNTADLLMKKEAVLKEGAGAKTDDTSENYRLAMEAIGNAIKVADRGGLHERAAQYLMARASYSMGLQTTAALLEGMALWEGMADLSKAAERFNEAGDSEGAKRAMREYNELLDSYIGPFVTQESPKGASRIWGFAQAARELSRVADIFVKLSDSRVGWANIKMKEAYFMLEAQEFPWALHATKQVITYFEKNSTTPNNSAVSPDKRHGDTLLKAMTLKIAILQRTGKAEEATKAIAARKKYVEANGLQKYVSIDIPPSHQLAMMARQNLNTITKVEDFLGLVKTVNGSDNDIYEIARQLAEENGEDYEKWEKFAGGESVDISVIPISHVSQYFQYINAIVDAIKKAFPDTKDKKPEDLIRLAKEIAKGEKLELLDNNRACEIVDNWKRSKAPNEIPRQVPPERVVVTRDKPPERSNDSPPKDKFRSERPKDNPSGSDRDPDKARKDDSTKTLKH